VKPVYSEPDGEVGELGYNLALRTKDNEVEIYRRYLKTDEQVKVKIQDNRRMIGAMTRSTKEYPSYIIDADGKYWKFLSRGEFVDEVKRAKKRIGEVYIHMPTSLLDMDTVASRDGLRQVKAVLREFDLPSHEITEK
jgi:small nuclear ribonucleoprotein (snRNP)-like protein